MNKPSQKQLDYLINLSEKKSIPVDHRELMRSIPTMSASYVGDLIESMKSGKYVSPQSMKTNKSITADPLGDMPQEWVQTVKRLYKKAMSQDNKQDGAIYYIELKQAGIEVKSNILDNYLVEVEKRSRAKFPELYADERVEGYDNLPFEDPYK